MQWVIAIYEHIFQYLQFHHLQILSNIPIYYLKVNISGI